MDRGRVGEDRGSKETDGCPLTITDIANIILCYENHSEHTQLAITHLGKCKGTSVCFLTFPLLSYSPLVHMYFSHTFVPSPGTTPKANDFCIQSQTTFRMLTHQKSLTFCLLFCSYLSSIRQALDTLGHVHVTLRHPPLSHGRLLMRGLVLGGLVL
jgi:hypothetical protein